MFPSKIVGLASILQVYFIQEEDLGTSSEVMEMDELNQNECMASLIGVINHLIKNKISPQPKQVNTNGYQEFLFNPTSTMFHRKRWIMSIVGRSGQRNAAMDVIFTQKGFF